MSQGRNLFPPPDPPDPTVSPFSSPPLSPNSVHNGFPFPPSNAPSRFLYKPASGPHLGNTRTTPQGLYPIRLHPGYTTSPCHCRHPQGDTIPRFSLEAVPPHRAMSGPPSRLFPSSTLFISFISSFAQRRVRSPHVVCN